MHGATPLLVPRVCIRVNSVSVCIHALRPILHSYFIISPL